MPLPKEAEGKPEFEVEVEEDIGPELDRRTPEQIRKDQINAAKQQAKGKPQAEDDDDSGIEIVDDTPEQDRNRDPLPTHIVEELERDELDLYTEDAKTRLQQLKKVWHDERREKERALREQQEAVSIAKKVMEENKRLRSRLTEGEKSFIDTAKSAAELEMEVAKRAYKEAYESGDADRVVEAQSQLGEANYRLQQIKSYKAPPLQEPETAVNNGYEEQSVPQSPPDPKALSWQKKNSWFGRNRLMTSLALGIHEDLVAERGQAYATTDEYYSRIDKVIREKFPEEFAAEEKDEVTKPTNGGGKPVGRIETKPAATVVAPASRSTSSKKIVLKQSEINLAKKFGLTAEQYAREKMRLENQNG